MLCYVMLCYVMLCYVIGAQPLVGEGLLIHEDSKSHTTTHLSRSDSGELLTGKANVISEDYTRLKPKGNKS
jgi:hypothetical protein